MKELYVRFLKTAWTLGLASLFLLGSVMPSRAQSVDTAASVLIAAEAVKNELNNVVSHLGAESHGVVSFASQQLTLQMNDFRGLVKDKLEVPLTRLSIDAQNLARALNTTTERLNQLLNKQRQCMAADSFIFLAAVRTIAEGIKDVPALSLGRARVAYFRFGEHSPAVIPQEGGRATVVGYNLWTSTAPVLQLRDETRSKEVAQLVAQRGSSDDEVSFIISKDMVKEREGQCLQLRIETRQRRYLFGIIPSGIEPTGEYYLPMCFPDEHPLTLRFEASHSYQCPRKEYRTLERQGGYYAEYNECNTNGPVTSTRQWAVPQNCAISSVSIFRETITRYEVNSTSESHSRDSVTLSSRLSARCLCIPVAGCRRLSHGVWSYSAQPTALCDVEDLKTASGSTSVFHISSNGNPITMCVDLAKDCSFSMSDFGYKIFRIDGTAESVFYEEPRISVGAGLPIVPVTLGKSVLSVSYSPGSAAIASQACVVAKMESCNY